MAPLSKAAKLKLCAGCRQNFYNGNNPMSIDECWSLPTAKKVKRKKIGLWDTPPWNHQPTVEILDCRSEQGYVFVEPHRTN